MNGLKPQKFKCTKIFEILDYVLSAVHASASVCEYVCTYMHVHLICVWTCVQLCIASSCTSNLPLPW